MTAFQSVNFTLGPRDLLGEATTPTAPRAPVEQVLRQPLPSQPHDDTGATTPTRNSFAAANGKRALPVSPPFDGSFPISQQSSNPEQQSDLSRADSNRSVQSMESQDVEMGQSDDGEDVSDTESNDDGDGRPSKKKKKGQRFFCKDYPPCSLSFTRSEHLARHIRKHTGERPFQCHCARRFSRLDNLRQHAQTVHVNEEIPGDSLAATGTRFQRQIRTDRVRPTGSRSRASTAGSQAPNGRGHARNLSTSSIASTASTMSTMSNMSSMSRETSQRRPTSLILGDQQSPRTRLTIDTIRASPQTSYNYANNSPGEASTPTSTNYANTPSSPFSSTLGSPVSFSRNPGPWGDKTQNRRLSVPSGANPFQTSPGSHGPPYLKPLAPSIASQNSSNSSLVTSPTNSVHSFSRDFNPTDPDPRRRTWHPSTYTNYNYQRPATSGLTFYQTPDAPRPAFAPQAVAAAGQSHRLPGFETFDQISQRPATPSRQSSHSTQAETPGRPMLYSATSDRSIPGPNDRRGHASWDMSLHQNLTKLDIANGTPPKEQSSHWGKQGTTEIQSAAPSTSRAFQFPPGALQSSSQASGVTVPTYEPQKRPSDSDHYPPAPPTTSQRSKREGWYHGPITVPQQAMRAQRPSPEDSSSSDGAPTPSTTSMDYQPSIVHPNGYVETQPAAPKAPVPNFSHPIHPNNAPSQSNQTPRAMQFPKSELSGLDALVAVATSENKGQSIIQHQ